ncbi:MAG: ribbon-helix-helix protein, CopG family [Candidatus Competibacteraceae bacterium]|nr:ribbon-helix-helix protein, CopG family [Candidatus Competibacteraceae bacterium]
MNLVAQMVHLESEQKQALAELARRKGGSLSAEVRQAIAQHLDSVSNEELALLDVLSRQAEEDIRAMVELLDENQREHQAFLQEVTRLRHQHGDAGKIP